MVMAAWPTKDPESGVPAFAMAKSADDERGRAAGLEELVLAAVVTTLRPLGRSLAMVSPTVSWLHRRVQWLMPLAGDSETYVPGAMSTPTWKVPWPGISA